MCNVQSVNDVILAISQQMRSFGASLLNAHRFDEYLQVNVDQFGRMRPLAPYFSHLSLFAEGSSLVDIF